MYSKSWHIIKDDSKRTFEVIGQFTNDNSFTNKTYAMQKAGMTVSGVTLPANNKTASRDIIKIAGYTKEDGLHERLLAKYREISRLLDESSNI
jgi:hypothetical protein